MKSYNFTIRLLGSVEAESPLDAETKINKHLDDLGQIESEHLPLRWADAEYEIGV